MASTRPPPPPSLHTNLLVAFFTDRRIIDTSTSPFFLLTARDLIRVAAASASIRTALAAVEVLDVKGRPHAAAADAADASTRAVFVPWPAFPGLFRTPTALASGFGLFAHQLASLHALRRAETSGTTLGFGAMRGGIFGDAPGLGKTVTALALIVSTAGTRAVDPLRSMGSRAPFIPERWLKLQASRALDGEQLNKGCLRGLMLYKDTLRDASMCSHADYRAAKNLLGEFSTLSASTLCSEPDYHASMFEGRFPTVDAYQEAVRAAVAANITAADVAERMRINDELRRGAAALRFQCSDLSAVPREMRERLVYESALRGSSATLVVVPDPLLEHWFEIVYRHLNLKFFADSHGDGLGRGVVWIDGFGDMANLTPPLNEKSNRDGGGGGTSSSSSAGARLPTARLLAGFMIVVTTFSRCAEQSRKLGRGTHDLEFTTSPLLELRWLRLIVDEGHAIGAHGDRAAEEELRQQRARDAASRKRARAFDDRAARDELGGGGDGGATLRTPEHEARLQAQRQREAKARALLRRIERAKGDSAAFISAIAAERRWVMSGTPTTGADDDLRSQQVSKLLAGGLAQIQRLLRFLRHPRYGVITEREIVPPSRREKLAQVVGLLETAGYFPPTTVDGEMWNTARRHDHIDRWIGLQLGGGGVGAGGGGGGRRGGRRGGGGGGGADDAAARPSRPRRSTRSTRPSRGKGGGSASMLSHTAEVDAATAIAQALWQIEIELPMVAHVRTMVAKNVRRIVGGDTHLARAASAARDKLVTLLRHLMVIHRKEVLSLPRPIFTDSEVIVDYRPLWEELGSSEFQSKVDKAQAVHIASRLTSAIDGGGSSSGGSKAPWGERPVKAVIFSSDRGNLLSVAERIYEDGRFGPNRCAEFTGGHNMGVGQPGGGYNSSELQRFRTNKRRFRVCPLCGEEDENNDRVPRCRRMLLEVLLDDIGEEAAVDHEGGGGEGGGGFLDELGMGGHRDPYDRRWYPEGALNAWRRAAVGGEWAIQPRRVLIEPARVVTKDSNYSSFSRRGAAHPFHFRTFHSEGGTSEQRVCASLSSRSIGMRIAVRLDPGVPGTRVRPRFAASEWERWGIARCRELALKDGRNVFCGEYEGSDWNLGPLPRVGERLQDNNNASRAFVRGDAATNVATAVLCKYDRCGNVHRTKWYTGPCLAESPWQVEANDVRILFLQQDGSHGLDLSFVTHIFLLERIDDAALLQQVVARAHRLGARGACVVETVHTFLDEKSDNGPFGFESGSGGSAASTDAAATPSSSSGLSSSTASAGMRDQSNVRHYWCVCLFFFLICGLPTQPPFIILVLNEFSSFASPLPPLFLVAYRHRATVSSATCRAQLRWTRKRMKQRARRIQPGWRCSALMTSLNGPSRRFTVRLNRLRCCDATKSA